jgi:TRAP-type uncharacterized transport system substrate-binding protein
MALVTACGATTGDNNTNNNNAPENKNQSNNSEPDKKEKAVLSIGTTPVGASINAVGSGVASVISTNSSSVQMSVKPFAGVSAWVPLLGKGDLDLGFATIPELTWAFKGENGFGAMKNMRLVVRGNYLKATGILRVKSRVL